MISTTASSIDFKQHNLPTISRDNSPEINSQSSDEVRILRDKGLKFISLKDYKNAAKYYSASLQLMEGIGGVENGNLRRRCALTLAECEIKSGNFYNAISACSQIIDESPKLDDDDKQHIHSNASLIIQALGKAHYRRGVSLIKLDQSQLALFDLNEAAKYFPEDTKIKSSIFQIKSIKKIKNKNSKYLKRENSSTMPDFRAQEDNTSNIDSDNHSDFIEDIIFSYPRNRFTSTQLKSMIKNDPFRKSISSSTTTNKISSTNMNSNPMDIFSSFGGGDTSSLPGGMGMLGGLGGLGGSLSLEGIKSMSPLITSLTGIDGKTISKIIESAEAVISAFKSFRSVYVEIMKRKEILIIVMIAIWTIFAFAFPLLENIHIPNNNPTVIKL